MGLWKGRKGGGGGRGKTAARASFMIFGLESLHHLFISKICINDVCLEIIYRRGLTSPTKVVYETTTTSTTTTPQNKNIIG